MVLDTIRTPRIPRRTDSWCPPLRKTQGWGSLKLWSSLEPKRKVGEPPILLVPLFPAANTPFLRAAVSHTQQHLGRPKAPQALDGSASPCHLLPAYGKQRRKYSPVFFHNHEDLVEKSGEVIQEDFEGSLMDVDASGHRRIKELAYSFRQSTSCERFFEKSASCFEFALLDTRVVFVSGRIEHFHLRPYRC
jgi:hypothetical protein